MSDTSTNWLASQRKVAYIGIPTEAVYRYCAEIDPSFGMVLDLRTDIANLGTTFGERSNDAGSLAQLSIAILADFLGDTARVARLCSSFAQRIRHLVSAERCWIVTEIDVIAAIRTAELDSNLTWDDKKGSYQDEPDQDLRDYRNFRKPLKVKAVKFAA